MFDNRYFKQALLAGVIVFLIGYALTASVWVKYAYENGRGFTGKAWQFPEITHYLSTVSSDSLIYSNNVSLVYVLSGRYACSVPFIGYSPQELVDSFITHLKQREGLIVFFDVNLPHTPRHAILSKPGELEEDDLDKLFSLNPILREKRGVIYQVVSPAK